MHPVILAIVMLLCLRQLNYGNYYRILTITMVTVITNLGKPFWLILHVNVSDIIITTRPVCTGLIRVHLQWYTFHCNHVNTTYFIPFINNPLITLILYHMSVENAWLPVRAQSHGFGLQEVIIGTDQIVAVVNFYILPPGLANTIK